MIVGYEEREGFARLGQTVRLARLRRNLTQGDLAEKMGVGRASVAALEAGSHSVSLAVLSKALTVLGYPERLGQIMVDDPIGDDIDAISGRLRAGRQPAIPPGSAMMIGGEPGAPAPPVGARLLRKRVSSIADVMS